MEPSGRRTWKNDRLDRTLYEDTIHGHLRDVKSMRAPPMAGILVPSGQPPLWRRAASEDCPHKTLITT